MGEVHEDIAFNLLLEEDRHTKVNGNLKVWPMNHFT